MDLTDGASRGGLVRLFVKTTHCLQHLCFGRIVCLCLHLDIYTVYRELV